MPGAYLSTVILNRDKMEKWFMVDFLGDGWLALYGVMMVLTG
jgi:hypothetical protein